MQLIFGCLGGSRVYIIEFFIFGYLNRPHVYISFICIKTTKCIPQITLCYHILILNAYFNI